MNAVVTEHSLRTAEGALPAERHDWRLAEVEALFELPFMDLLFRAQQVHRAHHAANRVQMSTLLSIKTGGCPEDCGYCPQSIHYETGVAREDTLPVAAVVDAARRAKDAGATRFCMGAAFRSPKKKDIERVATMIREVKALGLESCATTPASRTNRCCHWKWWWRAHRRHARPARRASAWARHSARRSGATWRRSRRWCARSAGWAWKPA